MFFIPDTFVYCQKSFVFLQQQWNLQLKHTANENYRIVKDKNENGLADTDDLLEADVQQLQAKINKVVGDADEQLAIYEYYYTTGILLENVQ